jgi:FkbM family methyltransferase
MDLQPVELKSGFSLFLPHDDKVSTPIMYHSKIWEEVETNILQKEIKQGDVVVDVGAYVGYYTVLLTMLVGPKGKVYAFEPEPENFAFLNKNVGFNDAKAVVYKSAVGETTGTTELYIDAENKGDHRIYDSKDGRDVIIVSKVKLDSIIKPPINFLKLDVQGSETLVLRGAKNLIANSPNLKVLTEFWPYGLHRCCQDDGHELLSILTAVGFKLYCIEKNATKPHLVVPTDLLGAFKPTKDEFCNLYCTKENLSW